MHKFTKAQLLSLYRVWVSEVARVESNREHGVTFPGDENGVPSYLGFRRRAFLAYGDCLMIPCKGMVLGIETDGYCHS